MASAVDSRLAYARLSAVATASRLPTANRGSNNSYTTSWDTTLGDAGWFGIGQLHIFGKLDFETAIDRSNSGGRARARQAQREGYGRVGAEPAKGIDLLELDLAQLLGLVLALADALGQRTGGRGKPCRHLRDRVRRAGATRQLGEDEPFVLELARLGRGRPGSRLNRESGVEGEAFAKIRPRRARSGAARVGPPRSRAPGQPPQPRERRGRRSVCEDPPTTS